jgi:hypothetical protein
MPVRKWLSVICGPETIQTPSGVIDPVKIWEFGTGLTATIDSVTSKMTLAASGGSVPGSTTQLIYNNAGAFAAASWLVTASGYLGIGTGTIATSGTGIRMGAGDGVYFRAASDNVAGLLFFGSTLYIGTNSSSAFQADTTDVRAATTVYLGVGSGGQIQLNSTGIDFAPAGSTVGMRFVPTAGNVATTGAIRLSAASSLITTRNTSNTINANVYFYDGGSSQFYGDTSNNVTSSFFYGSSEASLGNNSGAGGTYFRAQGAATTLGGYISNVLKFQVTSAKVSISNPLIGETTTSSPYSAHGAVSHTFAADTDYTITAAQYALDIIAFVTGSWTATHTVTLPHPASLALAYYQTIHNATLYKMTVSTGTGTAVVLYPGQKARLYVTSNGVEFATTRLVAAVTSKLDANLPYTMLAGDEVLHVSDTLTAARTVTLPATPVTGQQHRVKFSGLGGFLGTISGGANNIDGASAVYATADYQSFLFIYTGSEWSQF